MIGALIGAVAGIGGALLGGSAQKKAASTAAASADRTAQMNNALQREVYGQNRELLSPYVNAGLPASQAINSHLGLNGGPAQQDAFNQFRNSTGYDFRVRQGQDGINTGYAANGALQSGAAMKEMERYRQGMASQEFGNYMGLLGNQQGMGMGAASAVAGVGQNYANMVSQNNNMAGGANANAALMRGAASANMYGGIAQSIGNAAGNYFGSSYGAPPGYGGNQIISSGTAGNWGKGPFG